MKSGRQQNNQIYTHNKKEVRNMCNAPEAAIKWTLNNIPKSEDRQLQYMSLEEMKKASDFHKSFPKYSARSDRRVSGVTSY